jgi:hypothetical protein
MAYNDDDLLGAAEQQMRTLTAARSRIVADLEEARAYGDPAAIGQEIQALANLDQQVQALTNLAERHDRSQRPQYRAPETDGEFMAKSPERMNYEDVIRINSKSKYASNYKDEVENMRRGIEELRRRKAVGDTQT